MSYLISLFSFFLLIAGPCSPLEAKLLDRIVSIYNDRIITHSETQRIIENYDARSEISREIYPPITQTNGRVISQTIINTLMVRAKLEEIGYIITDEQVESQIKSTQKSAQIDRETLVSIIEAKNISFDEYFEIIRAAIEFNVFISRIISPMISITEQEVKNEYYKQNKNNRLVSFKYSVVDFSIPVGELTELQKDNFLLNLKNYQTKSFLPTHLKNLQTLAYSDIGEDDLSPVVKKAIHGVQEGHFTEPFVLGDSLHAFYVKKRDSVDSEKFRQQKHSIRNMLFVNESKKMVSLWFKRESNKHYIKYF